MRELIVAALAMMLVMIPLAMADEAEASSVVTFHYDNGGALYKETATGAPLNTAGIEATVGLGDWYYSDGTQWTAGDIITGDTDLYLGGPPAPPPEPDPGDDPVENDHRARGPPAWVGLCGGIIASAMVLVMAYAYYRRH